MSWSARRVQAVLLQHLGCGRRGLCMPRYTPDLWFECDVAEVTKAGYLREYEIKVSRQDFKCDRDKASSRLGIPRWWVAHRGTGYKEEEYKHHRLAQHDPSGPSRFSFVVPEGLVELQEVPEWAGLLLCTTSGRRDRIVVARPAPRLHGQRVTDEFRQHMRGVSYYRYLNNESHYKEKSR